MSERNIGFAIGTNPTVTNHIRLNANNNDDSIGDRFEVSSGTIIKEH